VNFDLTPEERDLQRWVRELCAKRFPTERLRKTAGRVDRDDWGALWEAGVFDITSPQDGSDVATGFKDAVLVFEELGRALVPGPLVGTLSCPPGSVAGVVERIASVIDHLESLDALQVIDDEGLWLVLELDEIDAEPIEDPLDPLTPLHRVRALPQGKQLAGPEAARRRRLEGAGLTAALQLGIATRTTELAVAYAKEREQFGRPIGSFQAVKHICADMLVRAEVARAAVYAAGVTLDDPSVGDVDRAVAAAKLLADRAAFRNGKDCVQVHGGMGFTWEVDVHLYLKRAVFLQTVFGSRDEHAETMAGCL
jgi:alkylation response protein AidB-like acyl-CoA dehydrogenase